MECSRSAPPPACARSERHELCPGTTSPVGQYWSSRSDVAHRASELAAEHDRSQLVDHRVEARVEPDLRGGAGTRRPARTSRARSRSRSRAASRTAAACPRSSVARTRSRCVVVGVTMATASTSGCVDHRARIRADRLERADRLRGCARRLRRGRRPPPDGPRRPRRAAGARRRGPARSCRSRRGRSRWGPCRTWGHAADRVRKTTMRCASVRTASAVVLLPVSARTLRRRRCRRGPPSPPAHCAGLRERSHAANGWKRQHVRVTASRNGAADVKIA